MSSWQEADPIRPTLFLNGSKKGLKEIVSEEHTRYEVLVSSNTSCDYSDTSEETLIIDKKSNKSWYDDQKQSYNTPSVERERYNVINIVCSNGVSYRVAYLENTFPDLRDEGIYNPLWIERAIESLFSEEWNRHTMYTDDSSDVSRYLLNQSINNNAPNNHPSEYIIYESNSAGIGHIPNSEFSGLSTCNIIMNELESTVTSVNYLLTEEEQQFAESLTYNIDNNEDR